MSEQSIILGILEEGKVPPDERAPFNPEQLIQIRDQFSAKVFVQKSAVRRIKDEVYEKAGLDLNSQMDHCDVLFGVKEVPIDRLIDGKTYFFFSHTIKQQPYNRELLRAILKKNIRLIDYECLVDENNLRLLGFGRYAGLVGAYNGFRMIGKKTNEYSLPPAFELEDQTEMFSKLKGIKIGPLKICITGKGRVANGAIEIMDWLGIKEVSIEEYLEEAFVEPVYVNLAVTDYNKRKDGKAAERMDFFKNPDKYESDFKRFQSVTDYYIACHYWDENAPFLITEEDLKSEDFGIRYIADISCDIAGPIASTIRPSTISEPFYGINKESLSENDFMIKESLAVMAVDNLPCELPVDATRDFGAQLMEKVIPHLFNGDAENILERATIAENGKLTERFSYLEDYVKGG